VAYLSGLLNTGRRRRRPRCGRRAPGPWRRAVLVLRWFLDATRVAQLATDDQLSNSTTYRYLHEGVDVLAAVAPGLHGALLAARTAGTPPRRRRRHPDPHRPLGGGRPDREGRPVVVGRAPPSRGDVQVVTAPDGRPLRTSPVRPGHEHDVTRARTHSDLLDDLDRCSDDEHVVLADPGYVGEDARLVRPIRTSSKPGTTTVLSVEQRTVDVPHPATRAVAEHGSSLLKTTFKALRRVSLCPWRIGAITAAALVLLHHEHDRTT
jgi:hypothetical protein